MLPRRLDQIGAAIGGDLLQGDPGAIASGVSIDSRTLQPGDLFFAIRGETHDGHRFIDAAERKGAAGAVIDGDVTAPSGFPLLRVDDATSALQRLAQDERRRRGFKLVAITGSSGKTTTRALAAAALSARFKTASSVGNLNNHWGLPLSILCLPAECEAAVLEMGMNNPGEIAQLTRIAVPDVGVITNVGTAHLGNFADERGIAAAKCELLDEMPAAGIGVVHAGSPLLMERVQSSGRRLIKFGLEPGADLRAADLGGDLLQGARFNLDGRSIALSLWGRHAVLNALAALGAGRALGLSIEEMAPKLATVTPLAGRGRLLALAGSMLVVDETYNANPSAMQAVLEGLAASSWSGRRVAVLGDMRELGERSAELHARVGAVAARQKIDLLHAVGSFAAAMAHGARSAGLNRIEEHSDAQAAARVVPQSLHAGDLVLIKASRGTHLEIVLEAVQAAHAAGGAA